MQSQQEQGHSTVPHTVAVVLYHEKCFILVFLCNGLVIVHDIDFVALVSAYRSCCHSVDSVQRVMFHGLTQVHSEQNAFKHSNI